MKPDKGESIDFLGYGIWSITTYGYRPKDLIFLTYISSINPLSIVL